MGWHIVVYFEAPDLGELEPFFSSLPTQIVVDHMGRPDVTLGTEHPQFLRFIDWMERNPRVISKVSCPERLSKSGPPYADVIPYAKAIVERFPDRVLWGTDWPHPNMTTHAPDDGALVDFIPKIATTETLRQKLLVDNPHKLYWA
jgi:2-pyrone-4,6-dicarboxylate lactonase